MEYLEVFVLCGVITAYFGWALIQSTIDKINEDFEKNYGYDLKNNLDNKDKIKKLRMDVYKHLLYWNASRMFLLIIVLYISSDGFKDEGESLIGGVISTVIILYSFTQTNSYLKILNKRSR